VLLDWKMPGVDSFEVARRLRDAAAPGAAPALVLVTAYGDDATARRALAEGFAASLSKPVTPAALAAALARALGRRAPVPAAPEGDGLEPIEQLGGCRILLVEDNELNQIVADDLLRGVAGAQVRIAGNGQEALECLATQAFDLVLMDVQMPGMDGHEATRRLRANPALAGLPVVAMTAHAMARDRQLCLDAGMNDFVTKPFEPRELFKVLARWLPRARVVPATAAAPPVSFELGLHRCMGRRDLYARILRCFVDTHGDDAVQLCQALAGDDRARIERLAHSLVSTAGVIGADGLAELARALHVALSDGGPVSTPAQAEEFAQEHARVMDAVRTHLGTAPA
jgi:two-component system sensor histidine kinase/response regulator